MALKAKEVPRCAGQRGGASPGPGHVCAQLLQQALPVAHVQVGATRSDLALNALEDDLQLVVRLALEHRLHIRADRGVDPLTALACRMMSCSARTKAPCCSHPTPQLRDSNDGPVTLLRWHGWTSLQGAAVPVLWQVGKTYPAVQHLVWKPPREAALTPASHCCARQGRRLRVLTWAFA